MLGQRRLVEAELLRPLHLLELAVDDLRVCLPRRRLEEEKRAEPHQPSPVSPVSLPRKGLLPLQRISHSATRDGGCGARRRVRAASPESRVSTRWDGPRDEPTVHAVRRRLREPAIPP